ncbi:MAG: hypothetical protein ACLP9K_09240 [Nitrososphaerales archaeon]
MPSYVVYSVPIALTNQESIATPAPFQQMITVDSAQFSSYEATNLQNIAFFYSNGTIIPSWLESGNSNAATGTVYWLRLADGIPARSSITIYMGFATTATNLMNNQVTGEAPDLGPAGRYDDGNNVFLAYGDFALGLGSWTPYADSGGFLPTATSSGVEMLDGNGAESTFLVPQSSIPEIPLIVEYSWLAGGGWDSGSAVSVFGESPFGLSSGFGNYNTVKGSVYAAFDPWGAAYVLGQSVSGTDSTVASASFQHGSNNNWYVSELTVVNSSFATVGYTPAQYSMESFPLEVPMPLKGQIPYPFNNPTLVLSASDVNWSSTQWVSWIVARAFPPDGMMPLVSVGSPTVQTSSSSQAALTLTVTSTTTIISLQTVVSTITLPGSTSTETITKTVTHLVTTMPGSTSSQTTNTTESQQGGGAPPPPGLSQSAEIIIGSVLVIFIAFVLVRVVFWRRVKDMMERL